MAGKTFLAVTPRPKRSFGRRTLAGCGKTSSRAESETSAAKAAFKTIQLPQR